MEAVRSTNPFVFLSRRCFVLSQRCSVYPLFILGLILPAGAVGFGSAVPVGLTPRDPLITDGLLGTFPFTQPQLNIGHHIMFSLIYDSWQSSI